MRRPIAASLLGVALLLGAACGSDDATSDSTAPAPDGDEATGEITVLAASSLTDAFSGLAEEFEAEHPDTSIELSFGPTSELVAQIEQGAPADVFASADTANMDKVVAADAAAGDPTPMARNQLAIVVEPGNPLGISGLADLARDDIVLVLCDSEVPCGKFADQILAAAGVEADPASREANVKATLTKVELGEADAAVVYLSDTVTSDAVESVTIPDDQNVVTTLPIVALADAGNPELARAWIDFVVAHRDRFVSEYGFLAL